MAKKLGYKSFTELAYIRMNRFDYTPEMVASYRDQIHEVVPDRQQADARTSQTHGIKNPKLYDLGFVFKSGNPLPLGTTDEKSPTPRRCTRPFRPIPIISLTSWSITICSSSTRSRASRAVVI
jgi:hypothetical protein